MLGLKPCEIGGDSSNKAVTQYLGFIVLWAQSI